MNISRKNYFPLLITSFAFIFLSLILYFVVIAPTEDKNRQEEQAQDFPQDQDNKDSQEAVRADFYVSPKGEDLNLGDISSPLKTIQKALELAKPGQTIFLLPGVYYQDVVSVRDGKKDSPIKITGTKKAVVKGGGNGRVFEINHDYISLEGFSIDGLYGNSKNKSGYRDMLLYVVGKGNKDGVVGLKVLNMDLRNSGGECVRLKYFSNNNEVGYNRIENCGVYDFKFKAGGKNGEGIYIGTAPEQLTKNPTVDLDNSNNNYIHHNIINTNGNEGVDIKEGASGNIVEYNKVTGQKDPESGGLDSRGDGNIFRYNEVSGSVGAGIRLGGDKYKGRQYGKENQVYGNKFSNNKYGAIKIQATPQGKICENQSLNDGPDSGDHGSQIDLAASCS